VGNFPKHPDITGTSGNHYYAEDQYCAQKVRQRFVAKVYPFDLSVTGAGQFKYEVLLVHASPQRHSE
jgi:hypothetical protein